MGRASRIALILMLVITTIGCESSKKPEFETERKITTPKGSFTSNFEDAKKYGVLFKRGMRLRETQNFKEALEAFKDALDNHAAMRNEQAAVIDQIAITYEMMGNFSEAAKYYDLASEVTMNEDRRAALSKKAKELYQKAA